MQIERRRRGDVVVPDRRQTRPGGDGGRQRLRDFGRRRRTDGLRRHLFVALAHWRRRRRGNGALRRTALRLRSGRLLRTATWPGVLRPAGAATIARGPRRDTKPDGHHQRQQLLNGPHEEKHLTSADVDASDCRAGAWNRPVQIVRGVRFERRLFLGATDVKVHNLLKTFLTRPPPCSPPDSTRALC